MWTSHLLYVLLAAFWPYLVQKVTGPPYVEYKAKYAQSSSKEYGPFPVWSSVLLLINIFLAPCLKAISFYSGEGNLWLKERYIDKSFSLKVIVHGDGFPLTCILQKVGVSLNNSKVTALSLPINSRCILSEPVKRVKSLTEPITLLFTWDNIESISECESITFSLFLTEEFLIYESISSLQVIVPWLRRSIVISVWSHLLLRETGKSIVF